MFLLTSEVIHGEGSWKDGGFCTLPSKIFMRTSSNGNIFRVIGPLCGEFTGHRWIPLTKAFDAELWCFHEQTIE